MLVEHMLLAEDRLPDHDDLITIRNLPLILGRITSLTEHTASEDLGYTILHHVNSLANDLIGPTIPRPASAPAPGLAVLTLPSRVEFLHLMYETSPLMFPIRSRTMRYWSHWSIPQASIERSTCRPLLGPLALIITPPILMRRTVPITSPDSSE